MAMGSSPPPPEEIRSPEQDKAAEDASAAQGEEEEEQFDDAFDIPHKNASHDSLLRWRVRDPSLRPFLSARP
jgi:Ca2+-transporting ATPase